MNTASNQFHKTLTSIAIAAISFLVSTTVLARPNQLDILGLVPGISELTQVQQAGIDLDNHSDKGIRLEIGGHKIPCALSFINDKLASLVCLTGNRTDKYTEASNIEVHSTLIIGFTKKFGKPDSVTRSSVRTRMGVKYEKQTVTWKDKRGNKLQLSSIVDTVDVGIITFESSEYLKQEAENNAADQVRKKF